MALFMKQDKKNLVLPMAAGAAGLVIGAASAVAAIAAYDKNVRKMLMERFNMVKNRASSGIKYVMNRTKELKGKARKTG